VFGLPLGDLAARRGRRFALATGWWVAAAGAGLLILAAQWGLVAPLFVGLLLIGSGSATSLQSRFAATDLARPRHRARALATVVWVGTLGSVLGPNLGVPGALLGAVTGLSVFAAAFLIAAVCMAGAGVIIVLALRPDPLLLARAAESWADGATAGAATAGRPASRRPGRLAALGAELRQNPSARFAVLAILTGQIVMVAIMTMTPVHITHHGGTVSIVGVTISLHVLGMFAFSPVVGMIVDAVGHRLPIGIGIGILLLSLIVGTAGPGSTGWIMVDLVLLGLGWSFVNVSASALLSTVITGDRRASAQGGVDALANLGGAFAGFVSGPLLAATSFSVLSVLSMVVLVPLTVSMVAGRGSRTGSSTL
jgi:MFS family permease